jgi:hypothetical protein
VAFFIAGIIPVFDNVFPDEYAHARPGIPFLFQCEPHRPNGAGRHGRGELFSKSEQY